MRTGDTNTMTEEDNAEHAPDLTADDAAKEPDAFSTGRGLSYRFDAEGPQEGD